MAIKDIYEAYAEACKQENAYYNSADYYRAEGERKAREAEMNGEAVAERREQLGKWVQWLDESDPSLFSGGDLSFWSQSTGVLEFAYTLPMEVK